MRGRRLKLEFGKQISGVWVVGIRAEHAVEQLAASSNFSEPDASLGFEKIGADCAGCALFRRCGQSAMRLRLDQATAGLGACA